GVGTPLVAIPLLSLFIDVQPAVMLLSVPLVLSNIPQALEGGGTAKTMKVLLPVILAVIPGTLRGEQIMSHANSRTIDAIAGSALLLTSLSMFAAPRFRLQWGLTWIGVLAGFVAGILGVWRPSVDRWFSCF